MCDEGDKKQHDSEYADGERGGVSVTGILAVVVKQWRWCIPVDNYCCIVRSAWVWKVGVDIGAFIGGHCAEFAT